MWLIVLFKKKLGGDLPGRSKAVMIVFLKVKFKRFVQSSQKFRIYPNSIKQKYDFNSCFLYSKKAKYLNSDFKKTSYDVLKIPRKTSLKKMRGYPSFKMSFFQNSDVICSLGHHPCSLLGLVYWNHEKHFWALLIPKHESLIKLGNILL